VNGIPDDVRAFILAHIGSVEQLEVLLLVRRERARAWNGPEIARELRIHETSAGMRLEDLAARGLLVREADRFRYDPPGDVERVIGNLARTYAELRVGVINLIFSKPVDRIRTFADAFKLKGGS
jgi:hypothetical protein